jgi:hypothetical protein
MIPKQTSAQAEEGLVRFNDNIVHDVDSNLLTFYTYMGRGNLNTDHCISFITNTSSFVRGPSSALIC